jgi:hypothetical protein
MSISEYKLRLLTGYSDHYERLADSLNTDAKTLRDQADALEHQALYHNSVLCGYCNGSGSIEYYDMHGGYQVQCWCGGVGYHNKSIKDIRDHYRAERYDDLY